MKVSMDFAQCLKSLLSILGMSINRLAKGINVDNSLVNRWVNGKRIPSYRSNYIEPIATYLAKNVKNTSQRKNIDDLYRRIFGNPGSTQDLEEKIKIMLFETQGFSHELQKKLREETKVVKKTGIDLCPEKSPEVITTIPSPLNDAISLSPDDKIILGTEQLLAAIFNLFQSAYLNKSLKNKKIYITFLNDVYLSLDFKKEMNPFKDFLQSLLNDGWEVCFLIKMDHNICKIIRFLYIIKCLLGLPGVHVYYIKSYESLLVGKDYVVIPELGAISCFFNASKSGTAIYLRNPVATILFMDYLENLIKNHAKPLLNFFPKK